MTLNDLLVLSYGSPSKELVQNAVDECDGLIAFYKQQLLLDKRPYWKGLIGHQAKIKKFYLNKHEKILKK